MYLTGVNHMDFKVFDTTKMDTYAQQAKEQWGHTDAYKEYKEKEKTQSLDTQKLAWPLLLFCFEYFI